MDTNRELIRAMFRDILDRVETPIDIIRYAAVIERGCYNASLDRAKAIGVNLTNTDPRYIGIYSAISSRVASCLQYDRCVDDMLSGVISPESLGGLTTHELIPWRSAELYRYVECRRSQGFEQKVSRLYTCSKCRGNKTTLQEYMSRASDEAATLSIKCADCGHVWRLH